MSIIAKEEEVATHKVCPICLRNLFKVNFAVVLERKDKCATNCKRCTALYSWFRVAKHKYEGNYQEIYEYQLGIANRYLKLATGLGTRDATVAEAKELNEWEDNRRKELKRRRREKK